MSAITLPNITSESKHMFDIGFSRPCMLDIEHTFEHSYRHRSEQTFGAVFDL